MSDDADGVTEVTPEQFEAILRVGEPITVLDVRDRDAFDRWHVTGEAATTVHAPHAKFIQAQIRGTVVDYAGEQGIDPRDNVVVVCPQGEASRQVAGLLDEAGIDAGNLAGGLSAWADLLLADPVADDPAAVVQYRRPATGCLSYLVAADKEAVAVDPLRAFGGRYPGDAVALGAELTHVVDTHVHADHLSGAREIADRTDAELVLPEGARDRGLADDVDATFLADGDAVSVGGRTLEAVALPGHTTEMTGLRLDDHLICGDSVFLDGVARPDLERGAEGAAELARVLHETIVDRIRPLPDETVLLPGHYGDATTHAEGAYAATLGAVRDRVPALSLPVDEFVDHVTEDLPERPANFERIRDANLGVVDVDEDEAFELELGPNNCAV